MIFSKIIDSIAKRYQASVARTLREYGLKYQDLLIEEMPEIKEALHRADPALLEARSRRLARAGDLSLKQKPLPEHIQQSYDPFDPYLTPLIEQVKLEMKEKRAINRNILS
mmetsp:Transcript_6381/g.9564  ORF Transcript_6381/g.9564 Transcript_6381/m.9564 type:complete len:111 (-) Transcript_6381:86-418(-)